MNMYWGECYFCVNCNVLKIKIMMEKSKLIHLKWGLRLNHCNQGGILEHLFTTPYLPYLYTIHSSIRSSLLITPYHATNSYHIISSTSNEHQFTTHVHYPLIYPFNSTVPSRPIAPYHKPYYTTTPYHTIPHPHIRPRRHTMYHPSRNHLGQG